MIPIIAISMGDVNGIGPEVAVKALSHVDLNSSIPVWVGSIQVFKDVLKLTGLEIPFRLVDGESGLTNGAVYVVDPFTDSEITPRPGVLSAEAGKAAMVAIETGAKLCTNQLCHALVTAPISKEAINKAGYHFPGHTEFLAQLTGADPVMMMLVTQSLRVALSTIHIPVKDIAKQITRERLISQIRTLNRSLVNDFGIESPRIAVLGLNPHAGDGGIIGSEEIEIILPAIQSVNQENIDAEGPYAADGYFGSGQYKNFDAVLAMYHDQGLVPFKTLSFGKGVNFTANLPIIRTSPDHGTAFNIAGKNMADEHSFLEAYQLAVNMAQIKFGVPD